MTCKTFRMIVDNQVKEFDLSVTPEAASEALDVINITDEQRSYVLRSPVIEDTEADYSIVINGTRTDARVRVADGFAISRHNLNGTHDSYRLRLLLDGVEQFDSGEIGVATLIPWGIWQAGINYWGEPYDTAGFDQVNVIWFDAVTYDSFELTLTKRPSSDPYREYIPWIDLGMCFLGKSLRPDYNFDWGNSVSWDHGYEYTRTQGHSLVTENGGDPYRTLSLNCSNLTDQDRDKFSPEIRRTIGSPLLIAAYPENDSRVRENEYTMIAKLKPADDWSHTEVNQHSHTFTFFEV